MYCNANRVLVRINLCASANFGQIAHMVDDGRTVQFMLGPALTLLGSGGQVPGWTSGPLAWGLVRFAAASAGWSASRKSQPHGCGSVAGMSTFVERR